MTLPDPIRPCLRVPPPTPSARASILHLPGQGDSPAPQNQSRHPCLVCVGSRLTLGASLDVALSWLLPTTPLPPPILMLQPPHPTGCPESSQYPRLQCLPLSLHSPPLKAHCGPLTGHRTLWARAPPGSSKSWGPISCRDAQMHSSMPTHLHPTPHPALGWCESCCLDAPS